MLHNIDVKKLHELRDRDPEFDELITQLIANHDQAISTLTHELRNPLTIVYSCLQLVEEKYPEVLDYKFWGSAMNNTELTVDILTNMSTLNNSKRVKIEPLAISSFIDKILISYNSTLQGTSIYLQNAIPRDLPHIMGDPVKLQQVFLNLLNNAKDAVNGDGQITVDAYVDHTPEGDDVIISIEDDGCGIPVANKNAIFEPFRTFKKNGTGIGLPVAKNIIEAHDGELTLKSVFNKGTTFFIRLPV